MRNNQYLKDRLDYIWRTYFDDCSQPNEIIIRFGPKAKKRLGSIRRTNIVNQKQFDTLILMNGRFRDEFVPEFVVDATIAHELVHYIQGFSSPFPQLCKYPHRNGELDQEMKKRGIRELETREKEWLDRHWPRYAGLR